MFRVSVGSILMSKLSEGYALHRVVAFDVNLTQGLCLVRCSISRHNLPQDHANIPVPPSKEDFNMVGSLQKKRGGFGKMAQQSWKNRYFILMSNKNLSFLAYFEVQGVPPPSPVCVPCSLLRFSTTSPFLYFPSSC